MQCPNCGHENTPDAKFCSQCGTSLSITCPVCSTVSGPTAKFCNNCGSDLRTRTAPTSTAADLARYLPPQLLDKMRSARAGHAMEGERRTVTILFADIKGSTASAEQLDPEDWAVIVNGAFEHLIAPVYRYEGTLAHLQGDAILAFFGAPIAHEDDPVRALRAGLEILEAMGRYNSEVQETWGIPIEVRVGVNTGLVVVGEVGSDLRVEYTALGDAINVAARMEQTAEPGTVRVTGGTLALTGGAFEVEDLGPIEVKGRSEPVIAHRVVRFIGEGVVDEDRPMVGRSQELQVLDGLRSRLTDGSGWIASIIADAGVGKSMLLHELRRRSEEQLIVASRYDDPGDVAWMLGASRSYDASTPFSAIGDLLRRWWGFNGADRPFARVEESVARVGLGDRDAAAYLGYIGGIHLSEKAAAFIDALETPKRHANSVEELTSYLTAVAMHVPCIIVFEDLHWADDLSLEIVDSLMELTERAPIGLLVVMRPYREEPTWRIHEVAERDHHHRYHHIDLTTLTREDSAELLHSLLGDSPVSEDIKQSVLNRAEGNPLFIEEMARSVKEAGPQPPMEAVMPTSLTGILTARLDRLEEESRFVVQLASVLGSEFDRDMLSALLEGANADTQVTDLLKRGILAEGGKSGSLAFRHALIQDAAYATILRRTRKNLHRRVAGHLIEARPDAVQDIARHLLEADEAELAFPYLVKAGLRASRSMALADAINLYGTALENLPHEVDPELVEQAFDGLGEAYALVPDLTQAAAAYQRLYEFGETAGRPSARVAALNRLAYATASLGADLEGAASYLKDARALAEEVGDDIGLAEYHMNACFVASFGGQIGEAVAHDESTVELGEKSGVEWIRLAGLVRRAINYVALLDFDRALPAIEAALTAADEAGLEESGAIVRAFGSAFVHLRDGDLHKAIEEADRAHPTLERYASFYATMNQRNIGSLLIELGDLEGALSRFADGKRLAEKLGQNFIVGASAAGMALVYATAGMNGAAEEQRAETIEKLKTPMSDFMASSAWADLGFTSLRLDDRKQADADFTQGLAASSFTQFLDRPRLLAGRALSRTLLADLDSARSALDEAHSFTREKGFAPYNALLAYAEGTLRLADGRLEEAEESLVSAQQIAMDRGERLLLVAILQTRSRLAEASGNLTEAGSHRQAARMAIEAIAASIADEDLQRGFASTWLASLDQTTPDPSA
jgi:class 3 adenylate cyclase/tetratricopeptide (TPR) repeat protein